MLSGVKNKDVGPAGDSLQNIVTTIRGFSVSELDVRRSPSVGAAGACGTLCQVRGPFETVQTQIDKVTDELLMHEHTLLKDIKSLDILYGKNLTFYDELGLYIAAGEAKLKELDSVGNPLQRRKGLPLPPRLIR